MKLLKVVVPVFLVLFATWMITSALKASKPSPKRSSPPNLPPSVETISVNPTNYQVTIPTRGEVRARTRSSLIPEVPGRIIKVSANFRDGGFFEKDEVLVEIDPRDYETAITVAQSNLSEAQNAHQQEQARAEQAKENWQRLGQGKEPNDLVLRVPQLAEAKARELAAKAQLDQALVDLERTQLRAPYPGRILEQLVDVGQFVNTGTTIARTFAVDFAEVRLPLTNQQAGFIRLPEDFRGESPSSQTDPLPNVTLTKQQGLQTYRWDGKVIRTEGAIDTRSRQLFVVAQIDNPYQKRDDGTPPLKLGDFIEAQISGNILESVYVIPRTALREGDQVLTVDSDNRLRIRSIEVAWGDQDNVVVTSGLKPGDIVCTKPPAYATEGAKVLTTPPPGQTRPPQQ